MPTTRPDWSRIGPPLLPLAIGALNWTTLVSLPIPHRAETLPAGRLRPRAEQALEREAEHHDVLAEMDVGGVAEAGGGGERAVDPEHGDVVARIGEDDLGRRASSCRWRPRPCCAPSMTWKLVRTWLGSTAKPLPEKELPGGGRRSSP